MSHRTRCMRDSGRGVRSTQAILGVYRFTYAHVVLEPETFFFLISTTKIRDSKVFK